MLIDQTGAHLIHLLLVASAVLLRLVSLVVADEAALSHHELLRSLLELRYLLVIIQAL